MFWVPFGFPSHRSQINFIQILTAYLLYRIIPIVVIQANLNAAPLDQTQLSSQHNPSWFAIHSLGNNIHSAVKADSFITQSKYFTLPIALHQGGGMSKWSRPRINCLQVTVDRNSTNTGNELVSRLCSVIQPQLPFPGGY